MWKVGDKIVCIKKLTAESWPESMLELGHSYTIRISLDRSVKINNHPAPFLLDRFITLGEFRKIKLDKIMKK